MGYRNWKRHLLALTMASSMILSTGSIGAEEPLIEDIGVEISQNMEEEQFVDIMEDSSAVAETQEVEDGSDILNVDTTDDIWEILEDSENISTVEDDVLNTETEEDSETDENPEAAEEALAEEILDLLADETGDGFIEEEEFVEEADEFEEELWEYFAAEGSGNASDTTYEKASVLKNFSSYGAQLSGESRKMYDAMVSAWVTKRGTGAITYKFSAPYVLRTNATTVNGSIKWDANNDTVYQKAYKEAMKKIEYQAQSALDAFRYDYPEVFWMGSVGWVCSGGPGSDSKGIYLTVSGVTFVTAEVYSGAKSEVASFDRAVTAAVSEIKSALPSGADRYQTVMEIHNYICRAVAYEENTYAHTAAGVFLHGQKVVCEGYAKAFKILCDRFGIPCALIAGDAKTDEGDASEAHMWNYVKMEDNAWYLVDPTWDDVDSLGIITGFYFLVGSSTTGYYIPVSQERNITGTFSMSSNTINFGVPALSTDRYVHHIWKQVSRREPTCTHAGSRELECTLHGETKTEILPAGHIFTNYVSNKDATCLKDGTKTAVCDRCRNARDTVTDTGSKLKAYAKFNASSVTLKTKQSTSGFKVTQMQKGDSIVSWTSSNKNIAKVSGKAGGTCKIKAGSKTGTAKITVKFKSGLKKTFKVKVQKGKVKTRSITGVPASLTLKKGQSYTLNPKRSPFTSKEKLIYETSNRKIAKVSSKGVIRALSPGKVQITVKSGSKKTVYKIKVTKK